MAKFQVGDVVRLTEECASTFHYEIREYTVIQVGEYGFRDSSVVKLNFDQPMHSLREINPWFWEVWLELVERDSQIPLPFQWRKPCLK